MLGPAFSNVHVYPLMAEVLGIEPAESEGALAAVAGLLRE